MTTTSTEDRDFPANYALWDEFLKAWPLERLRTMSLQEYTQSGNQDTFTYWLEAGLDKLGSIWGGSAFKFGIYSRKDSTEKESGGGNCYSAEYGWYCKYGKTEAEAFEHVRALVLGVAEAARRKDLEAIQKTDLGEAFKWKIAFHYQDRAAPSVVDIFKTAPLRLYLGDAPADATMAELQHRVMERKPPETAILEYGRQVWAVWSAKPNAIWKVSHGNRDFEEDERQRFLVQRLVR